MRFEVYTLLVAALFTVQEVSAVDNAYCMVKQDEFALDEVHQLLGSTKIKSRMKSLSLHEIFSHWAFTEPQMAHNLAIIDNNEPDCSGTPLIPLGLEFFTNYHGFGGVVSTVENLSMIGDNTIVGKYLQLTTSNG